MEKLHSITHVILTGGVGSRLWPLSRKSQPKQYLDLFEGKSLFEMTVERNRTLVDQVMVVGNIDNCHLSRQVLEKSNTPYIDIIESTPRNTAAAIAFAALASDPEAILIVTPSDHIIDDMEQYNQAIQEAIEKASQGFIVTFGIVPTKPETGYGYIERRGDDVVSFREKPNKVTATDFIAKGNFLWNSGMFCFKAGVLLDELKAFHPEVYEKSNIAWDANINGNLDLNLSLEIPAISIDYAVMEKADNVFVLPATFDWNDLGTWGSLHEKLPKDDYNNAVVNATVILENASNNIIRTEGTKLIVIDGLNDYIIVDKDDVLLIYPKNKEQEIKSIVSKINI